MRSSDSGQHPSLTKYLPQVVIATFAVAVFPVLAVWALRRAGLLSSPVIAIALGAALALGTSYLGGSYWKSRPGSGDLLFSELMLWGWARRMLVERRLADTLQLLGGLDDGAPSSAEHHERLLIALATGLESRDPYTHGHSRRVARNAGVIARRMGLSQHAVAKVRIAAVLHDVGKLATPRRILHNRGRLTDAEFAVVKQHPVHGAEMVAALGDPELTATVRHHHERIDGTGYPDRLHGEEIPLAARIIAVADTFDAIISTRPYRSGSPHKRALDVLVAEAGTQLDPGAVRAFKSYYAGRRALAIWVVVVNLPERFASWAGTGVNTAAAASVARVMTASALTTAVAVGAVSSPMLASSSPSLSSQPTMALTAAAHTPGAPNGSALSTSMPTAAAPSSLVLARALQRTLGGSSGGVQLPTLLALGVPASSQPMLPGLPAILPPTQSAGAPITASGTGAVASALTGQPGGADTTGAAGTAGAVSPTPNTGPSGGQGATSSQGATSGQGPVTAGSPVGGQGGASGGGQGQGQGNAVGSGGSAQGHSGTGSTNANSGNGNAGANSNAGGSGGGSGTTAPSGPGDSGGNANAGANSNAGGNSDPGPASNGNGNGNGNAGANSNAGGNGNGVANGNAGAHGNPHKSS